MNKNSKGEPYSYRHFPQGKDFLLGKVVRISAGRAYVVSIDLQGNMLEDETTIIQPMSCRGLRVSARRKIEVAPARYEVTAFDIKVGDHVVYTPSEDPNYARVWCFLDHYVWALDLYDNEYHERVLEGRTPPPPVMVPRGCRLATESQLKVDELVDRV